MKRTQFMLSMMLPVIALTTALCFTNQPAHAQDHPNSLRYTPAQQQPVQPDDQNTATVKTFNGKIVKSGDKLVLAADDKTTTYDLDDQQRAKDFLNQTVKATGVLDASTGTIRVTAIKPA